jgi:hypothetical protein
VISTTSHSLEEKKYPDNEFVFALAQFFSHFLSAALEAADKPVL